MLTKHARLRCQQRSIPPFAIDLYEKYGVCARHRGADVLYMDKAAHKRMERDFGGPRALRMIEPLLGGYAVVENGRVITIAHRTGRMKRDVVRRAR